MKQVAAQAVATWNRFWFESDYAEQVRLFRTVFGALMFVVYLLRTIDLSTYYGASGIMAPSIVDDTIDPLFRMSVLYWVHGQWAVWAAHFIALASFFSMAMGWLPRIAAIVALAMQLSFHHRDFAVLFGVDIISNYFLFFMALADHRPRSQIPREGDFRSMLGSVAFRFCQIQLCVIYAYSGFRKFTGVSWWHGDALWYALANSQMARFDFSWLAHFPILIIAASYVTMIWEVYFPVLIWVPKARPYVLAFGVALHAAIAITMKIPSFGVIMILTYSFFLSPEVARRVTLLLSKVFVFSKVRLGFSDRSYV